MSEQEQREQEINRIMRIQRERIEFKKREEADRISKRVERESLKARYLTQGYQGIENPHLASCRACATRIADLLTLPDPDNCTLNKQQ
jgi:hypothetical protein